MFKDKSELEVRMSDNGLEVELSDSFRYCAIKFNAVNDGRFFLENRSEGSNIFCFL